MAKILNLPEPHWEEIVTRALAATTGDQLRAGEPDPVVAGVAEHLSAPVRAVFLATSGNDGVLVRFSLVSDRVLVVAQPVRERSGRIGLVGKARLIFAEPTESWEAIAGLLPPLASLRAPAAASAGAESEGEIVPLDAAMWATEQANLQVRVEAWRGAEPPVVWGRWWSVVDGRLYDIRRRSGEFAAVERPEGSVAAEFEWALTGAIDACANVDTTGAET